MTGGELAQRAGISTSYVSLIETGAKVPDEEVAAGIARALGDDETLYRAWARAARLGFHDLALLRELERIARTPAYSKLVESGEELPKREPSAAGAEVGDRGGELAARLREVASRLTPSRVAAGDALDVVAVPVLAEGAEPGRPTAAPSRSVRHRLLLDRRLVGEHDPRHLFAYEVTARAMQHLRGVASPGDLIVFRRGGTLTPDRICAVRTGRGIVLSRALLRDALLLLLPGEAESHFDSVAVPDATALSEAVAGTHVLLLRH